MDLFTANTFRWPNGKTGEPQIYVVGKRNVGKTTLVDKLLKAFASAGHLPSDVFHHDGDFLIHEVQYAEAVSTTKPNTYIILFKGALDNSNAFEQARPTVETLADYETCVYDVERNVVARAAF